VKLTNPDWRHVYRTKKGKLFPGAQVNGSIFGFQRKQCDQLRLEQQRFCDAFPAVEPKIVDGEMKNNSPNGFLNPDCHFQQALSQSGYLSCRRNDSCPLSAHLLRENVGSGGHEDSKLIGKKTHAACSVNLQAVVQFYDTILGISLAAVDLADIIRFVRKIRGYGMVVVPGMPTGTSKDFGLDDDAATLLPFPRCIGRFARDCFGLYCLLRFHSDFSHRAPGSLRQSGVSGHSHQIVDTFQFEIIENRGRGEAPIGQDTKTGLGKCIPQPEDEAQQDSDDPARVRRVTGPQYDSEEMLFGFIVELQSPDHGQVAIRVVVHAKEHELLRGVRGIVRRILGDRNQPNFAFQSFGVMFDSSISQLATHLGEVLA
jgi:hypothetical protein